MNALIETTITSLPLVAKGKVRDIYAVGTDHLLMITTDRLSAFDVVFPNGIPGKGKILNQFSLFWFKMFEPIISNHLSGIAPESVVAANEVEQVKDRSVVVKRLKAVPLEAVVRGYLEGSGWKEYQLSQRVCGIVLPQGLPRAGKLPQPIFTPATKALVGEHDENISFEQACQRVGESLATQVREVSVKLYQRAADYALQRGIIIADTKFEFGLDEQNQLVLMDEVLTPDSSRFWPKITYKPGESPQSFDKQYVRNWLESIHWNKTPPAPALTDEVIQATYSKYVEAWQYLSK
ncbi:MAG: phosphoribosylaminoimidazolesuccinocarboxamide synthase [Ferrovum sp. 37-45-19]|uniref:phosphoribosylaminoimidazolesuccinocarboxamide synthase n=1 Tax=Ferrovum sp. JA12 TaxID=1356299 RepID=UPI0007034354|nr:phosphoribosylaminoimidazolesuccinocarboxamide synthase [Ferrovum sp. JA12]OYV79342.1 MAG: phosphoribosylaminoimidazolesuccinocarboxamide synthase [Ferrovum sp. 21-44-67]OYV94019.1 MAG: phosphoribosylaminoimidazolesuccinocarboxamide synthase [Ferrovum sp. 37-45-19]OZB34446.1 MAG: phosphoribosylaminoimidazolesuccinocarboxamide synthase [Ferrovum sp. 34-44-207]HQT81855.1 phosphoribosylaminoimidazolesuccinocarboxamide synthase [Ferrovaceae bacterium]KRH79344.1 phosphoribosylaminoimidazole-succ